MAPSPAKIPHLLEPYIHLPSSGSLLLLTSVLGASTNWLVLRYLSAVLAGDANGATATDGPGINGGAKVVLVSFMRDMNFWREGARRLVCFLSSPVHESDVQLADWNWLIQ